jgi:predicted DNA-binding antitoxin AbrB/MazE fold protein
MTRQVEAVYENGMLRPLEPLDLDEHQQVTVRIIDSSVDPLRSYLDLAYIESVRTEVDAMDYIPSIEEVRAITSKDPTSWAEAVIADREDRF